MTQGIFIAGTDTGIGKTLASCLLIDALVQEGNKVVGMKPIASGASSVEGKLQNEDAMYLQQYSNVEAPYEKINPYCFEPPVAPHIAAQKAGREIDLSTIRQSYNQLSVMADWVIVEGVGGWYVPINDNQTTADIPLALNLPVVLVVGMKLGCINHALLAVNAIRASGNELAGWIANDIDKDMAVHDEVLETLQTRLGCPLIARIPYLHDDQRDTNQPIKINTKPLKS